MTPAVASKPQTSPQTLPPQEVCAGCGSRSLKKSFDAAEPPFEVHRCGSCGLGASLPPVPAEEIGRWYPESYYGKENVRFNVAIELLTRIFRWRRARVIRRRVARGPVMDVGCGRGFILAYLRELGYEAHGVEFSDTAAWHARNVLGLDVHTGDFLSSPHEKARYNAVVLWHSLEHLPRPAEAVARARELLKPGGLLAVAVPNFDSLQARLFGPRWFHLDVPRHYWHFGERSLRGLLSRQGFRVVQLDHFSFEQNPYGWLQSFYNALGFDFNFLYSLLKNKTARSYRVRKHPVQTLLTLLLLPPLAVLSLALTVLEAALRSGGTIEVYAVKR